VGVSLALGVKQGRATRVRTELVHVSQVHFRISCLRRRRGYSRKVVASGSMAWNRSVAVRRRRFWYARPMGEKYEF
jgi:hypothetical protein